MALAALVCCAAAPEEQTPIEREFERLDRRGDLVLTLVDSGKTAQLVARSETGTDASQAIMRIKRSWKNGEGRTFRFYFLRGAELEAITEYHWSAPSGSLNFRRSRERRIAFEGGLPIPGSNGLRAGEGTRLVDEASAYYGRIVDERARLDAKR